MADDAQVSAAADLAGYPTTEELVKAYRASGAEAKRQKERADLLEQQIRQPVPQRDEQGRFMRPMRPEERLSELGVPVDALDELLNQRIQQAFAPLAQGLQARTEIVSRYPDYNKFENEVAQYVNRDPELQGRYQRMFATDPVGAMEYAYMKFGQSKRQEVTPQPNGNGQALKEAQIPAGRSSEGKSNPSGQDELLAQGWERYQKTGDPTSYAKARLRQAISDEFLAK